MVKTLVVSLLLLSACSNQSTDVANMPPRLSSEDSLRESVFRYQFGHNASGQQQSAKAYFLSVRVLDDATGHWRDGNPSKELLAHFSGNVPPVRAFSECSLSVQGVFDTLTGDLGLLFQVGAIRWIARDSAEVDGGYFESGLSASGDTYYLERNNGQWAVTMDVLHWISLHVPSRTATGTSGMLTGYRHQPRGPGTPGIIQ